MGTATASAGQNGALARANAPASSKGRQRGVAEEEALGQGGARVANALAAVEEPQAQRVARQKAGEGSEREAHSRAGGREDQAQGHRFRQEAPAAVLGGQRHGLPRHGGAGWVLHGPILPVDAPGAMTEVMRKADSLDSTRSPESLRAMA